MQNNPEAAARRVLAEETRSSLPADIRGLIEEPFHGHGIPRMLVFDDFARGKARHALYFEWNGRQFHLHNAVRNGTLVLNRETEVRGYRLRAHLLMLEITPLP